MLLYAAGDCFAERLPAYYFLGMVTMHTALVFCKLPLQSIPRYTSHAANQACMDIARASTPPFFWGNECSNVRLLRRQHDPDRTRFALSGKMADVCQALDALAARELAHNARLATS